MKTLSFWLSLIMVFALFSVATAQSIWLEPQPKPGFTFEFDKPDFDDPGGFYDDGPSYSFFTAVYTLSSRVRISPTMLGVVELPIGHYNYDAGYYDISETDVGNPYLGIITDPRQPGSLELGVRLPVVDAGSIGVATGLSGDIERWEAYFAKMASLVGHYSYRTPTSNNFFMRLRIGSSLMFDTSGDREDSMEAYAMVSAQGWYDSLPLKLGTGIFSRAILTEEVDDLGERTIWDFGITVLYQANNWQPGMSIRLPLDDDLSSMIDSVIGLNITYIMP